MNDLSFKRGMIAGLQLAAKIVDESASNSQIEATIDGAVMVLESLNEKVTDE